MTWRDVLEWKNGRLAYEKKEALAAARAAGYRFVADHASVYFVTDQGLLHTGLHPSILGR